MKSNLSGEFTVINEYLVRDLKARGLWDDVMVTDLKYFDGSLRQIDRVPQDLRDALRDGVRGRAELAGRSRGAPPEVDRPGAVAQHLHGRRLGQEARRDLQARLAARPEDDLLPAHDRRDAHAEKSTVQDRRAERGVGRRRASAARSAAATALRRCCGRRRAASPTGDRIKFCAIDDPECEACQ